MPTNVSTFRSGTPGSAWFEVLGTPNLTFVTQWDALVRRLQRAERALLPSTFPSVTHPGTVRQRDAITVDGTYGPMTVDGLAELMRRSGYGDEVNTLVREYTSNQLERYNLINAIFFGLFAHGVGTIDAPSIRGGVRRPQIRIPANQILPNGAVRSPELYQNYVGFYPTDGAITQDTTRAVSVATEVPEGPFVATNQGYAGLPQNVTPGATQTIVTAVQDLFTKGGGSSETAQPATKDSNADTGLVVYGSKGGGETSVAPTQQALNLPQMAVTTGLPEPGIPAWGYGLMAVGAAAVVGTGVYLLAKPKAESTKDEVVAKSAEAMPRRRLR